VLYMIGIRLTSRALLHLWPEAAVARSVARTLWIAASIGAAVAALTYRGEGWGDLRDAVLEIAACAFPLLFIPLERFKLQTSEMSVTIARSYVAIVISLVVCGIFAATLGRGVAL
jgi:hypothetical protein